MLNKKISCVFTVCLATLLGCFSGTSFAGKLEPSIQVEMKIDKSAQATQKQIDRLAEDTLDINADYKSVLTQIEDYKAYNMRLERAINEQQKEMDSLQSQMNTIDETERGLLPLMDEMIDMLAEFVEADVPFKKEERLNTVDRLRTTMLRADVSTSEKYRQILTAYTTEIAQGNAVDVYEGQQEIGGVEKQVDYIQFGRTALMFASRGEPAMAAIWDKSAKDWKWLEGDQVTFVRDAIKDIEMKQKKLIVVPVATAEKG
ncbi:DUF3450 domain-containing protein [Pleionea sediminis]|uniref:DUF3450 domain-containing protein n=1 Tax=Pleionea sediminis TaxID=2569479 RepID=UPI0011853808|nr:DUF3450 domain-containing protein [Pleionea sediminis]